MLRGGSKRSTKFPPVIIIIIMPHRSTSHMRPVATDGVAWSVCHDREPCKSGSTDCDAVPGADSGVRKDPGIVWGPDLHEKGQF